MGRFLSKNLQKGKSDMMTKALSFKRIANILMLAGLIATIIFCLWGYQSGFFSSASSYESFLLSTGIWAPLIFILLQIAQVVVPVIPGGLGCVAGVLIFGPVYGFIYNYIGISIGSVLNFLLARKYGKPFIQNMVSEKTYEKYIGWLDKGSKFDKFFAIAIFSPMAPDDFLCMLAGITKMTLKKFTAIILLCKPCSILAYSMGLTAAFQWAAGIIR